MKKTTLAPVPPATKLTARLITTADLFQSVVGSMPNPDEVLRDAGEAISVYRSMRYDPRVKSLLKVAKAAILNVPIRLDQKTASDEVMKACEQGLELVSLTGLARRALSAMDYGYAVVEVVWTSRDGWWIPADLVLRKPERFRFDYEGKPIFKGTNGERPLDEAYRWLIYRHDKDAENPYGSSALASCYWPWKMKKAGLEFWLMAAEKFAVPSILALFESGEGEDKLRERAIELSQMLTSMQSGSGGAMANIKDVKIIESPETLSEFKTLMDWCDIQIAYGLVNQSLAVQEAENGTRAQAEVHADTFTQTSRLTCLDLTAVLQRLVDWIVELNFGPGELSPKVAFDLEDFASWEVISKAIELGIPISKAALYDRYGIPEPVDAEDAYLKPAEPQAPGLALADPVKKNSRRPVRIR